MKNFKMENPVVGPNGLPKSAASEKGPFDTAHILRSSVFMRVPVKIRR